LTLNASEKNMISKQFMKGKSKNKIQSIFCSKLSICFNFSL